MSRVVFAGPSLFGVERPTGLTFAPPAAQGDLLAAVQAGATHIGLVDGYFGACASVWHKEILFALSQGCQVFGAASMGALRAAECRQFGMEPVGTIAAGYADGTLTDDADVALVHGPAEFDYIPFTEPFVDVRVTLSALAKNGFISFDEAELLLASARKLHFSARSLEALVAACAFSPSREVEICLLYDTHAVRLKRQDACLLLERMLAATGDQKNSGEWTLSQSPALSRLLAAHRP